MQNNNLNVGSGKVIWITGLSGSGKTTVSRIMANLLNELGVSVHLLDGDEMRKLLGSKWGYTPEDRRELAFVYARLAKFIAGNGAYVICATVAMFDEVRSWNRLNIQNYFEIFLRVPINVLEARDPKGLYKKFLENDNPESVLSQSFELPKDPDLIIDNFGVYSAYDAAKAATSRLIFPEANVEVSKHESCELNRLRISIESYWNNYYTKAYAPSHPTNFAKFCKSQYIDNDELLLEFGCGNGRDSFFFGQTNPVVAIDVSSIAVSRNKKLAKEMGLENMHFYSGYFGDVKLP